MQPRRRKRGKRRQTHEDVGDRKVTEHYACACQKTWDNKLAGRKSDKTVFLASTSLETYCAFLKNVLIERLVQEQKKRDEIYVFYTKNVSMVTILVLPVLRVCI